MNTQAWTVCVGYCWVLGIAVAACFSCWLLASFMIHSVSVWHWLGSQFSWFAFVGSSMMHL